MAIHQFNTRRITKPAPTPDQPYRKEYAFRVNGVSEPEGGLVIGAAYEVSTQQASYIEPAHLERIVTESLSHGLGHEIVKSKIGHTTEDCYFTMVQRHEIKVAVMSLQQQRYLLNKVDEVETLRDRVAELETQLAASRAMCAEVSIAASKYHAIKAALN